MKHSYYEFLISREKDNDLNNEEKNDLAIHLENCERCKAFKNKLNSLSSVLNSKNIFKPEEIKKIKTEEKKVFVFDNIKGNIRNTVIAAAAVFVFVIGITLVVKNKDNSGASFAIKESKKEITTEETNTYDVSLPLGGYLAYTLDSSKEGSVENNSEYKETEEIPMYTYFAYFDSEE